MKMYFFCVTSVPLWQTKPAAGKINLCNPWLTFFDEGKIAHIIVGLCFIFTSMFKQYFSKEEALQKAKHYCAYQERCHSEVKEKLYSFGMNKKEVDELLSELISENYLNEERFAILYAGGKFRIKQWGKIKIKYSLKQKQISEYCIKKALAAIDERDYNKTLEKLFDQKLKTLKAEKNIFTKKRKLQDYLMQKGFENDLVRKLIASVY
jgi:regulatory protein